MQTLESIIGRNTLNAVTAYWLQRANDGPAPRDFQGTIANLEKRKSAIVVFGLESVPMNLSAKLGTT